MLQERREKILDMLKKSGNVKVSELTALFDVSIETIRRDLEYLEGEGLLARVYGGAIPIKTRAVEPTYQTREIKNYAKKQAIGLRAVDLVEDGDVIAIDHGTTTLEFAKALVGKKKVTVITNALKIAITLAEDPNIRVIILGGEVRRGELAVSGHMSMDNLDHFNTDKYFVGVGGLSVSKGITDYHVEEANLRKTAIANTQKVIALTDYSKMGVIAMTNVCPLEDLDVLVTDQEADEEILKELRGMEIAVIQVES